MRRLRFTGFLLQPSVSSFIGTLVLVLGILTASSVSYASRQGFIYDLFLGSGSSPEFIQTSRSTVDAFIETVFGNPVLNKIIFLAFWVSVGLVVYLIVSGVGEAVSDADEVFDELQYTNVRKNHLQNTLLLRAALRTLAVFGWLFYTWIFFKIFLPFSVSAARVGVTQLSDPSGWFYLAIGFLVLAVSFHLHVVLLRLIALRPRLFGGWDVVDESSHKNE